MTNDNGNTFKDGPDIVTPRGQMTPEQKRIAIASAVHPEYTDYPIEYWYTQDDDTTRDYVWKKPLDDGCIESIRLPNYLNDLNAMHSAIKTLDRLELEKFLLHLRSVCALERPGKTTVYLSDCEIIHATASQRADAFLKTKGLL